MIAPVLLSLATAAIPKTQRHSDEAPKLCSNCATWNAEHAPFRIHGNSYYVGVDGLSSVLITSSKGHILIDGGLPQSAGLIAKNIQRLGYSIKDVKWLLNSHAHFDHVGGLAALQRMSGAKLAASPDSAEAMRLGNVLAGDPQAGFGNAMKFPIINNIKIIADGDSIVLGNNVLTALFTPGHTLGGTSWSWPSCEAGKCINVVFADSLNSVSDDSYQFSAHPEYISTFRRSIATVRGLKCDILISAHPEFSGLFERAEAHAFVDGQACRKYADAAEARLNNRLAEEAVK
jgi:metallo-beta-lactamase class B